MNPYIITPNILQETSEGIATYRIQDELFKYREIDCVGEITRESVHPIIMQLLFLQKVNPKEEILMRINSLGGEISSGMALYDVMQAVTCPIRTVCIGTAASMAAVLFASGSKRDMLPHARVMIHDPLISEGIGGSALKIDSISRDLMQTRENMACILAEHTGRTVEEVLEKTANDSYFGAEEAVDWGLADRIIYEL